jgi:FRG domain-containing protein
MTNQWNSETLATADDVFTRLGRLRANRWYCRGQSKQYGNLLPSIDRIPSIDCSKRKILTRIEKICKERESIDIFRTTARFFSHPGEMQSLTNDLIALAVLRHYEVPTRLLDWSRSPWIAAYFAVAGNDEEDGEIWSFDEAEYMKKGIAQWSDPERWEHEFSGAAFDINETSDFIVCMSYPLGFGRQNAQDGLYSVTSKFDCDHAERIEKLLANACLHNRYVIPTARSDDSIVNGSGSAPCDSWLPH